MNTADVGKFVDIAAGVVKAGMGLLGDSGAKTLLESIVDYLGHAAVSGHVDQYAAARLAADAAERAKFGDG